VIVGASGGLHSKVAHLVSNELGLVFPSDGHSHPSPYINRNIGFYSKRPRVHGHRHRLSDIPGFWIKVVGV